MLSEQQVAQFDREGFLNAGAALDEAQVEELREELMRVLRDKDRKDVPQPVRIVNLSAKPERPVWQVVNIYDASDAFRRTMNLPKIVQEIAQLTRANELRIWHDQIQYKPAEEGGVNMWHQDSPLWAPLTPKHEQVSAWIALDDVDASNGCMSMVPGSHKWGVEMPYLGTLKDFRSIPGEYKGHKIEVKLCPVKKGNVHYHHALTWHASHENTSGRPRRAIAYHFMTERTVYVLDKMHPMSQFIPVQEGEMVAGDRFPVVWRKEARVAVNV